MWKGRVQPGLELQTSVGDVPGKFSRLLFEQTEEIFMAEVIEIEKGERTPLRLGRSRDPDSQLRRLQLSDLFRTPRRDGVFLHFGFFGLKPGFAGLEAPPPCLTKEPKSILRQLTLSGTE